MWVFWIPVSVWEWVNSVNMMGRMSQWILEEDCTFTQLNCPPKSASVLPTRVGQCGNTCEWLKMWCLKPAYLEQSWCCKVKRSCGKWLRFKNLFLWLVELAEVHPTLPVLNTIISYWHVGGIGNVRNSEHAHTSKMMGKCVWSRDREKLPVNKQQGGLRTS